MMLHKQAVGCVCLKFSSCCSNCDHVEEGECNWYLEEGAEEQAGVDMVMSC